MMRPLLQYETRPYSSNPIYLIRAYGEGFKRCTGCEVLVKTDGARCPSCKRILKTRTNKGSIERVKQAFKKLPPKQQKICSNCHTLHSKTTTKGKWTYEKWSMDGNGGWHCATCHQRHRRAVNREKLLEQQRRWRRNNPDKVKAQQERRKITPESREQQKAYFKNYYHKNKASLYFKKRLKEYNPLNLKPWHG